MAGGDFIFTNAVGKLAYYAELPLVNDGLVMVLLREPYIAADDDMRNVPSLADIFGIALEANFTGYSRKTITSVAPVRDYAGGAVRVVGDRVDYVGVTGAVVNRLWKALICYDPILSGGDDSTVLPLAAFNIDRLTTANFQLTPPQSTSAYLQARGRGSR